MIEQGPGHNRGRLASCLCACSDPKGDAVPGSVVTLSPCGPIPEGLMKEACTLARRNKWNVDIRQFSLATCRENIDSAAHVRAGDDAKSCTGARKDGLDHEWVAPPGFAPRLVSHGRGTPPNRVTVRYSARHDEQGRRARNLPEGCRC